MPTPRIEFLAGVRATLPLLAGDLPFGLIYGVQGAAAHVPPLIIVAMSSIMILTTFVVNLRHLLYSASMGRHWRHLSRAWKSLLAYLLTDEAFAVTSRRYQTPDDPTHKHWYHLGAGLTLWISWQIVTLLGVLVGGQVPGSWALDFSVALAFIGIILPVLRDRAVIASAVAGGLAAVLAARLPLKLGLIVAAAVGITAGMVVEALTGGPKPAAEAGTTAERAPGGD
jgi:predicted branched-subunit amino acid permease